MGDSQKTRTIFLETEKIDLYLSLQSQIILEGIK